MPVTTASTVSPAPYPPIGPSGSLLPSASPGATIVPRTPSDGQTATTTGGSNELLSVLFLVLILAGLGALIYFLYNKFLGV